MARVEWWIAWHALHLMVHPNVESKAMWTLLGGKDGAPDLGLNLCSLIPVLRYFFFFDCGCDVGLELSSHICDISQFSGLGKAAP